MERSGRSFDWILCCWIIHDKQRTDRQRGRTCNCRTGYRARVSGMPCSRVSCVDDHGVGIGRNIVVKKGKQKYETAVYTGVVCGVCDMRFDITKNENGYFTVEAALIFPMALLFTVMMIFLAFYSYDRCILEQSAYEAALRGTGNHIKSAQEAYSKAYQAADTLVEGKLFAMHDFCCDVSVSADFVNVNYHCTGNMPLMGWLCEYVSGIDLRLNICAEARRCRPTRTIREIRVINKLIHEINKEEKEPAAKVQQED